MSEYSQGVEWKVIPALFPHLKKRNFSVYDSDNSYHFSCNSPPLTPLSKLRFQCFGVFLYNFQELSFFLIDVQIQWPCNSHIYYQQLVLSRIKYCLKSYFRIFYFIVFLSPSSTKSIKLKIYSLKSEASDVNLYGLNIIHWHFSKTEYLYLTVLDKWQWWMFRRQFIHFKSFNNYRRCLVPFYGLLIRRSWMNSWSFSSGARAIANFWYSSDMMRKSCNMMRKSSDTTKKIPILFLYYVWTT